MSFRSDLRDYLLARSAITALVGTRITPNKRDQGDALPAITYSKVSGRKNHALSGSVGECESEMQFDVWSTKELEAEQVVEALRDALDGYHGLMGSTNVNEVLWGDDSEFFVDESAVASDEGTFHFVVSVTFYHSESRPTFA